MCKVHDGGARCPIGFSEIRSDLTSDMIEIAVKGGVLPDVKLAVINEGCLYFEEIKAFAALEVQDFIAPDYLILERF